MGARRDRDLELAREVSVVGIAVEETGRLAEDGRGVECLRRVQPRDGAAGDVAHRVTAGARLVEADGGQPGEHLGHVPQLEPVELDVLSGGDLGIVPAQLDRQPCDGAKLRRRQQSAGRLDPQHEEPGLGLVVVQPVPLEPDDVFLRHGFVAPSGENRQLGQDVERELLDLEPFDRVPPQDVFFGNRFSH